MQQIHNKLVRDRIPEIIASSGNSCETEILSDADYLTALWQKLIEEAEEVVNASPSELLLELADLMEVVDAILAVKHIERDAVIAMQQQRRRERGGFSGKIKLISTELKNKV